MERQAGIPGKYKAGLGFEVVFDVAGREVRNIILILRELA